MAVLPYTPSAGHCVRNSARERASKVTVFEQRGLAFVLRLRFTVRGGRLLQIDAPERGAPVALRWNEDRTSVR